MNVVVGSMWRDSAPYIERAFDQYEALAKELDAQGDHCRFVFVENDSTDDTLERLRDFDATIVERHDDCPYWPSVDNRERWRHLAWVANGVLENVTEDDDAVIYVESDLAWEPRTMLRLLDHLDTVDAVAPLNLRFDGTLYDRWGSKGMDGVKFSIDRPFHADLVDGMAEVQSVAGCTAMRAEVARTCRFSPDDCYIGLNRSIRLNGWRLWCDPTLAVVHA